MRTYVDANIRVANFSEFDEYVKNNFITFALITPLNVENISDTSDLIFTNNEEIINILIEKKKNIIIRINYISLSILEKCVICFGIFGEKGKVYPPCQIYLRLFQSEK